MQDEFLMFLKRGGRSESARKRVGNCLRDFERFLVEQRGVAIKEAGADDLEAFVVWLEREPRTSAKTHLWALGYYFEFTANEDLRRLASVLREERIVRKPFRLRDFRGIDPEVADTLAAAGIRDVKQMLEAGKTRQGRTSLAVETGIPENVILELIKLSDLARIPGVKGIRARLYHDAGVDTVEKMAQWKPEALREAMVEFVDRTGFDGVPTLLEEARFTVAKAKALSHDIEY
jgi:predicted flap endonuclease-1-like 5' DNA nuclease